MTNAALAVTGVHGWSRAACGRTSIAPKYRGRGGPNASAAKIPQKPSFVTVLGRNLWFLPAEKIRAVDI